MQMGASALMIGPRRPPRGVRGLVRGVGRPGLLKGTERPWLTSVS
jgi:hypothetical protein